MEFSGPKYINPFTDFGFKKLFGEEGNKDLLVDFLNQFLPPKHQIADLTFRNVEALPDLPSERKAYFDIHCKAVTGERFIVEMQKAEVKFFKDRSLFYTTYPIREQAKKKKWDFRLEPVYFIAILDFFYDEKEELAKLRRDVSLKDQDNEEFFDKLHFKFLQMPAFKKQEHELVTHFDKWCYFLKNLESFEHIPAILKEPIFEKAFLTAELAKMTPVQRNAYESSRMNYLGVRAAIKTAKEKASLTGKAEGRAEKEKELVVEMNKEGIPLATIAKIAKLSLAQVKQIIASHQQS